MQNDHVFCICSLNYYGTGALSKAMSECKEKVESTIKVAWICILFEYMQYIRHLQL